MGRLLFTRTAYDFWVLFLPDSCGFTCKAAFSTLTNVGFDPERFPPMIRRCVDLREGLKEKVAAAGGKTDFPDGPAAFQPAGSLDEMVAQGRHEAVWDGRDDSGRQVASGTYFYRLEAGAHSETKRMVLVK